jgi:hypothetical protein
MNRIRGLVLVVGASFVLAALVTTICVKMAGDLAGGVGVQSGDFTTLGIGGLGAAAVLGISGRALWRERASIGWRIYGALIVLVVLVGIGFGAVFGARISNEHVEYVHGRAIETCTAFALVHPDRMADCETRAITCRADVHAAPPVVERGLHAGDAPGASREPTDPEERALWACLER